MFVVAVLLCGYLRCFKVLLLLRKKKENQHRKLSSATSYNHSSIPSFLPALLTSSRHSGISVTSATTPFLVPQ